MHPPTAWQRLRQRLVVLVAATALGAGGLALAPEAAAATSAIVAENQLPGSSAWHLGTSGHVVADDVNQQVKGYASATSVDVGGSIDLKVTANPAQDVTLQVFRMGWYQGLGARLVQTVGPLPATTQPACPVDSTTGTVECHWSTLRTLQVPTDWVSGIYLVVLTNAQGYQNYVQFVVRDDASHADLLYQQPVATYQAYNPYPSDGSTDCGKATPLTGKDLYDSQSSTTPTPVGRRAEKVSFDRPYSCSGAEDLTSADWSWELEFVRWMERSGYDVTYSTSLDTHEAGARLRQHKAFLSVGHDEYWSGAMFDAAQQARDAGVDLGFFGGNAVYWQVRFEPSSSGVPDRVMVGYKNTPNNSWSTLDPYPDPAGRTVRFQDPPVNRPAQTLLGVSFVSSTERSTMNGDLAVASPDSWVWGGTGVTAGATVSGIVGYEYDANDCHYPVPANTAYTVLGDSPMVDGSNIHADAQPVLYRAPGGAWVFSAGTVSWSWALDDKVDPRDPTRTADLVDPRIQQATKNLLDVFTGAATPGSTPTTLPSCSYDHTMRFEGGSVTGPDGANRTIGTVSLESTAALDGSGSAHVPGAAGSYLDEPTTAVDDLSLGFDVKLLSRPSVDVRLAVVSSLVYDLGNVVLRANADGTTTLQLRSGNLRIGTDSAPLSVGTDYRVTLRQTRGTGSNATLQASVAPSGTAGTVFASTTSGTWTTRADRVRIGSTTNNATTPPLLDALVDDVVVHGTSVPLSSDPPPAPTGLVVTSTGSTSVGLAWKDTSSDETSFVLQRSTGGGTWTQAGAALAPNTTSTTDSGLTPRTTYAYRVLATNVNGTSAPSNTTTATTTGVGPAAPSGLTVTQVSLTRADLSWQDNSTDETGFVVQRSNDSAFTAPLDVALPAGTTTWSDTWGEGVAYYRVKAVNGPDGSTWSGTARGSRDKDMTFEGGSLTGPLGASKVATTSTVYLTGTSPLRGSTSVRVPLGTTAGYVEEDLPATQDVIVSFYVSSLTRGTTDVRLAQFVHNSTGGTSAVNAGQLLLRKSGAIVLQNYNTTIGTGPTLDLGTPYRLALEQHRNPDGTISLKAYVAAGETPFGAPFASTASTPLATTVGADAVRVGATGSSGGLDALVDDVEVDTAFVPSPSSQAGTPPASPTSLTATPVSSSRVDLTWSDASTDELGFDVQRTADGSTWTPVGSMLPAGTTSTSDTSAGPGTSYQYRVVAVNAAGASAPSAVTTATTPAASVSTVPAAPTDLVATATSSTSVDLLWTDSSDNETGFAVQRSSGGSAWAQVGPTLPAGSTSATDTTASPATTYDYRVVALGQAGPSAPSGTATATTPAGAVPASPTGLQVTGSTTSSVSLAWTDTSSDETGFTLERSTDATTWSALPLSLGAGTTAATDTSTAPATTYSYRVRAYNAAGTSAPSSAVTTTTPAPPPPAAPLGLTATASSPTSVTLAWLDMSSDETGFVVQRSSGGSAWAQVGPTLPAGSTTATDTGLTPVTTYTYRVLAVSAAGSSTPSDPATVTTPAPPPPAAPTDLAAVAASATRVDLTWTDASTDETGFAVQRSTDGATWGAVGGTLPAGSTATSDTSVSPSTTYAYRVLAVSPYGSSAPSATATVTTPAAPPPGAPTGLTATQVTLGQVDLAWSDGGGLSTSLTLQRSNDPAFGTSLSVQLPAGTSAWSDTRGEGVAYYRLSATGPGGTSPWSTTVRGSRVQDATFEGGSLTGLLGTTSVTAGVTPVTATPLVGTTSARVPLGSTAAYLEQRLTATDELFTSFYLRPQAKPSSDVRVAELMQGTTPVMTANLVLRSNGSLQLLSGSTSLGTSPALKAGKTYRVALHQKRNADGTALVEAWLVLGDTAFPAPFASRTANPLPAGPGTSVVRVGAIGSAGGLDAWFDDLKLDTAFLPSASRSQ